MKEITQNIADEEILSIEKFLFSLIGITIKKVFNYIDMGIGVTPFIVTFYKEKIVLTTDEEVKFYDNKYDFPEEFITSEFLKDKDDIVLFGEKTPRNYGESYIGMILSYKTVDKYIKFNENMQEAKLTLIHSVGDEILKVCKTFLLTIEAENYKKRVPLSDAVDIVRRSAKRFISNLAGNREMGVEPFGLYELCEEISMLKYESAEAAGGFIVSGKWNENIELFLTFKEPIVIDQTNYRKIRKLVQMTDDEKFLYTDGFKIYGIGKIKQNDEYFTHNIFIIKIVKHHYWQIRHFDDILLEVINGYPSLPKENFSEQNFIEVFNRNFGKNIENNAKYIYNFIREAILQKKGTMILISDNAGKESIRLEAQSFLVKKEELDLSIVKKITSIDGAIILSPEGICYAIGTILDGNATSEADLSRGARYNSAVRYFETYKETNKSILVVISEDGTIDIISK